MARGNGFPGHGDLVPLMSLLAVSETPQRMNFPLNIKFCLLLDVAYTTNAFFHGTKDTEIISRKSSK